MLEKRIDLRDGRVKNKIDFAVISCTNNRSHSIAHNGKGLCEVRATATGSGEDNRTLAKTFSIF